MTNWQDEYINNLIASGRETVLSKIATLNRYIKQADKRTRNGKMSTIFDSAELIVCKDALKILNGEITLGTYKLMTEQIEMQTADTTAVIK